MRQIKNNELLRVKLSITQEEFAGYLGITRGLLSMYEQGIRSLPTPALLKLSELELSYHNFLQEKKSGKPVSIQHPQLQKHNEKAKKSMKDHAAFCYAKKNVLQHKLAKMIIEHANAETWSQLLDVMLQKVPTEKKKSPDHIWLEEQRATTLKKLLRYGTASQARLQAVIHVLAAEAAGYKSFYDKL